MALDESSVLMDRALVTLCQDLPESLGLYNTEKDQLALNAIRTVPLLEHVGADSRKLALVRDWMRAYEPAGDEPLSTEICMESLKETDRRERQEREKELLKVAMSAQDAAERGVENDKKKEKREKKREKNKRQRKDKETVKEEKMKAVADRDGRKKRKAETQRVHVEGSDVEDELSLDESSSSTSDDESMSSSSAESDSGSRPTRRTKRSSNLPPIEVVLSSDGDDDDEPNDMFDTEDPDVYEVEKILRKKTAETFGEQDLYEVKWEGYDETTWEPASNISKDLIDEFEGQPVREDVYTVQEIVDRRRKRDATTRLKTYEYKVKWVGYDELTWEPAENLPHNLRRKFDRSYETRERKRS